MIVKPSRFLILFLFVLSELIGAISMLSQN